MFTVLLGKPTRLFHQNRSQDWTLISVLLNAVLTVSLIFIFFIVRDIQSDYHQHLTRWLIIISCALNFVPLSAFTHFEPTRWNLLCFFLNISLPFPFQNKENWKCLLASTNVSALCLDFDEVSAILQALHIRALLSRSSGEMKFDSSSCMLKPVYFAFVKTMLEFFLQTTHFVKSRAHSPRPTSKIIAIIALRRAILMKADPVVSLHAHRLFSGRACSCKKDPCFKRGIFTDKFPIAHIRYIKILT